LPLDGVHGVVTEPVDIGTDYPLDRVTFHLPNLSEWQTATRCGEVDKATNKIIHSWYQVALMHDGWQITIQSRARLDWPAHPTPINRPVQFTAIGDIRRCDGQQFKRCEVTPVLEALHVFLSFADAEWITPLFIVGSNAKDERSWERFPAYRPSLPWHTSGWLNYHKADSLAAAYPGFCRLWAKGAWQRPIIQAVTWLIEASKHQDRLEGQEIN
jgi:hypothetical protein